MDSFADKVFQILEEGHQHSRSWAFGEIKFYVAQLKIKEIRKIRKPPPPPLNLSEYQSVRTEHNSSVISARETSNFQSTTRSIMNPVATSEKLYASIKLIESDFLLSNYTSRPTNSFNHQMSVQNRKKISEIGATFIKSKQQFLEKWMNRSNVQLITVESYPKSDLVYRQISSHNREALDLIRMNPFPDFLTTILRDKYSWGIKIDTMKHKTEPITSSLTRMKQDYYEVAVDMFDLILKCAESSETEFPQFYYASELVALAIDAACQELRQQLFVQLIKQMNSGKLIYLKLFALISSMVKISLRMYAPLLNYILIRYQVLLTDKNIDIQKREYFNFIFYAIIRNFNQPRKTGCTLFEANLVMNLRKIPVIVSFPTAKTLFFESNQTVPEIIQGIIQFFNLDASLSYLLMYSTCLFADGQAFDTFYRIHHSQRDLYAKFQGFKVLLVLRNMLEIKNSSKSFNLMYNYFLEQYKMNYYYLCKEDNIEVAALRILAECEYQSDYKIVLDDLLPAVLLRKQPASAHQVLLNRIGRAYLRLKNLGTTKHEARKAILNIISKRENFMAHFFRARLQFHDQDEVSYDCVVGIKPNKIIVIDYESGRYIKKIYFNEIKKYGWTKQKLCLTVSPFGMMYIKSGSVKLMVSVFETYVNELVKRKQEKDNQQKEEQEQQVTGRQNNRSSKQSVNQP